MSREIEYKNVKHKDMKSFLSPNNELTLKKIWGKGYPNFSGDFSFIPFKSKEN